MRSLESCTLHLLSLLIFPVAGSWAQTPANDSLLYQSALANAISLHDRSFHDQSGLLNGNFYLGYPYEFNEGSPYFFESDKFMNGNIFYDRMQFENVPLLYDNLNEVVITKIGLDGLQLVNEKIDGFVISDHHFIRLDKEEGLKKNGFYEVLFDGNTSVYKKQKKKVDEKLSQPEGIQRLIEAADQYFIKKNNKFYPVSGRKEILDILSDKKTEIKEFIKKNKIRSAEFEIALIKIVAFYNQLMK